jgi:hypothetical protein
MTFSTSPRHRFLTRRLPAPPRFLPPFDNAILAHAERRRIIAPEHRYAIYRDRRIRTALIDGFVAGAWQIDADTLHIEPIAPLRGRDRAALLSEAERLLAFLTPDDVGGEIVIR